MASVSGGNAFSQKLQEIAGKIGDGTAVVKIGFLSGATYPDGKPVALIASIQEFGAPNNRMFGGSPAPIPPRPFFRRMIAKHRSEWPSGIATQLRETDFDIEKTLARTGEAISGQLRQSIVDTNSPPLSPATLALRGYTGKAYDPKDAATFGAKPLVHTGHLLQSVDYEVKR